MGSVPKKNVWGIPKQKHSSHFLSIVVTDLIVEAYKAIKASSVLRLATVGEQTTYLFTHWRAGKWKVRHMKSEDTKYSLMNKTCNYCPPPRLFMKWFTGHEKEMRNLLIFCYEPCRAFNLGRSLPNRRVVGRDFQIEKGPPFPSL